MTMVTMRRLWILPAVALVAFVALNAFTDALASPPELFSAMRERNPRPSHGLDSLTAAPASGTVATRAVALRRMQPKFSASNGFREAFLTPRMLAAFPRENTVATADLTNPSSNPVMTDPAALELVEKRAIRAVTRALESYTIESLGIDRWSLRLTGRSGRSSAAPAADSRPVRFHLGFSRLAPRGDLLIPVTSGRVVLSADLRGHIRTTFEPNSSKLRLAADVDLPEQTATVRLSLQF